MTRRLEDRMRLRGTRMPDYLNPLTDNWGEIIHVAGIRRRR